MTPVETKGSIVRSDSEGGFALVITLTLLALLVLAVFGLTALGRINSRIAATSVQQTQARQNALLALNVALAELQRDAGPDARVTGMAGVCGVPPQNTFRQWAGVWGGVSSPVWLVSAANKSATPGLSGDRITIVGSHSVGNPTNTTDQEPVEVGLIDLPGFDTQGFFVRSGRMGYWVGDEGAKVSAVVADDELQLGKASGIGIRPNFRILIGSGFDPGSPANSQLISLEQLKVLVTGFSLGGSFHSLTRSHAALPSTANAGVAHPGNYVLGAFNINTTSEAAWRALLEFPDSSNPAFNLGAARTLSAARQIRDKIVNRARPFDTIDDLLGSNIIQESFDNASPKITTVTQDDFIAELRPILTTRSDTFRIRAYGDVLDSVDHTAVQSQAYCEAIVQRTPEAAPDALGKRFIVTYFRWLGREDI